MLHRLHKLLDRRGLHKAYHDVFNTEQGKIVLHDMLRRGHVLHSSYAPGGGDMSIFREGERNHVLGTLQKLNVTVDQIEELTNEAPNYRIKDSNYD